MEEPLLPEGGDSSGPLATAAAHHKQLIVHTPFSVETFIQFVIQRWAAFLRTLTDCLRALLGQQTFTLSLRQAEQLEQLRDSLAVPYDPSSPEHQQQLRELWARTFPDKPCTALKTPQWKEMGWQGEDPATDFRGAGIFGLDNLLYLADQHPRLWQQLLHKSQGVRAEWEYPFAVAGLNLTFALGDLLELHGNKGKVPATPAGRGFVGLLQQEGDVAFQELYCTAFCLLDQVWLEQKASYMEFNQVMKEVKARLDQALRRQPKTVAALSSSLGVRLPPS